MESGTWNISLLFAFQTHPVQYKVYRLCTGTFYTVYIYMFTYLHISLVLLTAENSYVASYTFQYQAAEKLVLASQ